MQRMATFVLRGAGAAAGSAAMLAGLVFAILGDGGRAPEAAATPFTPIVAVPAEAATAYETSIIDISPEAPAPNDRLAPSPTVLETPSPDSPVTQVPGAKQVSQPLPSATPTPAEASPITDVPAYSDVQVLSMAASLRLPSGRTFEQCVALGPNGKHWPVPVHLYYEGKGMWLVETHLSEVQVEFDEASASFHVKHFAPEATECLTPG